MFLENIFKHNYDNQIKKVEKLIKELTELKESVIEHNNSDAIDIEIAEMIGTLKARGKTITNTEIVEFLVYLSDKTKTKADTNKQHFNDTMMKMVHAKIELLLIYHRGLTKVSAIRQIFSMDTVWPLLFVLLTIVSTIVVVHKFDPSLFHDLGIGSKK